LSLDIYINDPLFHLVGVIGLSLLGLPVRCRCVFLRILGYLESSIPEFSFFHAGQLPSSKYTIPLPAMLQVTWWGDIGPKDSPFRDGVHTQQRTLRYRPCPAESPTP
jgi:hypothetical protein